MRKESDFSKAKRGAAIHSPGKTRITIMLDDDVIEFFRAKAEQQSSGYQTMINAALRQFLAAELGKSPDDRPLTVAVLRKVLREELRQQRRARFKTVRLAATCAEPVGLKFGLIEADAHAGRE